jgi:GAF domain-containing protein
MLLDSSPERAYDDIVRLLAQGLGVPIVMVNLLDAHRDWFKACVGLPLSESSAATSFCEQFFHSGDNLIVVPDTLQDPRFAQHPLVMGEPNVRFYAAARLHTGGQTLGTLCAYDLAPRHLTASQLDLLHSQAAAVIEMLARRLNP